MIIRRDKPKEKSPAADGETKTGRPKMADSDRRDILVKVLTTEGEFKALESAAKKAGAAVSTWMRMAALEKAQDG